MSRRHVLVAVDLDDALIVGTTLRMLARVERSPDPAVAERLARVGDHLRNAAERERRDLGAGR